jgi:hypothetical protein
LSSISVPGAPPTWQVPRPGSKTARRVVVIYTVSYNWVLIHKTLRVISALQGGLTDPVWDFAEIVTLMDEVAKSE